MRHFKEEDWLDFVRQAGSPYGHAPMAEHLAAGCLSCDEEARFWRKVQAVAGRELYPAPSPAVMRLARASWQAHRPANLHRWRRLELIFDSYSQPLVAIATRAAGPAWRHPRQMLFAAGDVNVDLRLEPIEAAGQPARVALVGQLQRRSNPESLAPSLTVRLMNGNRILGETTSNPLGEFQLEFAAGGSLQLAIGGEDGFVLPLPD